MLPCAEMPPERPAPPAREAPPGACDTHVHMLAAADEFALWPSRVEDPPPGLTLAECLARYRTQMAVLGVDRTVIVHSILYGSDHAVTLAAMDALGRERTRAVGLVEDEVDDVVLDALRAEGVMGVRLNYVHGGILSFEGVKALAPRLAARDMHVQMLINAHQHMAELAEEIRDLPVPVVFDHLGWPDLREGAEEMGFRMLCDLVADGHAWVKLSGLYRFCDAPYEAADDAVASLIATNSERCLWGSDWPHVMLGEAKMPDTGVLLDAFDRVVGDEATRRRILVDNPAALYEFTGEVGRQRRR